MGSLRLVKSNATVMLPVLNSSYSEASYFDGYHFQHIAAFEEEARLQRIKDQCKNAITKNYLFGCRNIR